MPGIAPCINSLDKLYSKQSLFAFSAKILNAGLMKKKYADAVSVREDPMLKRCAFKRNTAETIPKCSLPSNRCTERSVIF